MNPPNAALAAEITKLIGEQCYAQTKEIAGAVASPASNDAAFVNGATLESDGGLSA